MIKISVYQKRDGILFGFKVKGHAGYADKGEDIVCAAVSVLVINTINSVEAFTEDVFRVSEKDGMTEFEITEAVSRESALLLNSFMLGLDGIRKEYGGYLKIITVIK